jgi:hypothetical protein
MPTEDDQHRWERMKQEAVAGYRQLQIPKRPGRPERMAKIAIRYASLRLRPPVRTKLQPADVWAVYAREEDHGPAVKEPIEWILLTTVAVCSFDDAIERIHWYTLRWGIELFHRILKSGCRIEDRLLDDTESLKNRQPVG